MNQIRLAIVSPAAHRRALEHLLTIVGQLVESSLRFFQLPAQTLRFAVQPLEFTCRTLLLGGLVDGFFLLTLRARCADQHLTAGREDIRQIDTVGR